MPIDIFDLPQLTDNMRKRNYAIRVTIWIPAADERGRSKDGDLANVTYTLSGFDIVTITNMAHVYRGSCSWSSLFSELNECLLYLEWTSRSSVCSWARVCYSYVDKAQCFRSARRIGAAGSSPGFSRVLHDIWLLEILSRNTPLDKQSCRQLDNEWIGWVVCTWHRGLV